MRAVCVIGLGLIGSSVLRGAVAAGRLAWGATTSEADASAARAEGYDVSATTEAALRRAAAEDALVVIATPLTSLREVLRQIAWHAPQAWLTDVISVKDPVAEEIRDLLPTVRYAGGHPMAGASESGWGAGSANLFQDASWAVVTEDETELDAWREAARLALDCGAKVVPVTAAEHDAAVARISHLPHVFAAVLAAVGADGGPLALSLAAGSFRDATRVARGSPELIRAMTEGNRTALIDAVDDALGRLGAARGSLASTGSLKSTVDVGHAARESLVSSHFGGVRNSTIRLDSPASRRRLRELGDRGGRVVALTTDAVTAEIPASE